ncbi:MAG TPA: EAL domain-containing protein [Chroococcidiopsis sp.]
MSTPLHVLLVEDSEEDALLLVLELERNGYSPQYKRVDTATAMQAALTQQSWDVILADYSMPQFTAVNALQVMQELEVDLPFIIVSGSVGEETAVAAMKAGAHDYLLKDNLTRLVPTIEREIRDATVRRERKQAFETIRFLAFFDALTGLPNRALFLKTLQDCIEHSQATQSHFGVVLVDVDRYQTIKYSLGHLLGEQFLVALSHKLKSCLREGDLLARVGDDEFAILLPGLLPNDFEPWSEPDEAIAHSSGSSSSHSNGHSNGYSNGNSHSCSCTPPKFQSAPQPELQTTFQPESQPTFQPKPQPEPQNTVADNSLGDRTAISCLCDRIHKTLDVPFEFSGVTLFSTCSIGIALSTTNYNQAEDFLRAADTARYYARLRGKNKVAWFDASMQAQAIARLDLETNLQQAIQNQHNQHLYLHYQPIVALNNNHLTALEALARWDHPQRGTIPPSSFIALAEETELIVALGRWVLQRVCRQAQEWRSLYPSTPIPRMSVNLSAKQLMRPGLIDDIDQLFETYQLDGSCLEVELTESVLMDNAHQTRALLIQLKQRGIRVCIDDFGTGYSSLSYLTELPIDTVKIDRSFIHQMTQNTKQLDVVTAILMLAQSLRLTVVAEGIETEKQLNLLRSLGCDYGQGYLFSRPVSPEVVRTELLGQWN